MKSDECLASYPFNSTHLTTSLIQEHEYFYLSYGNKINLKAHFRRKILCFFFCHMFVIPLCASVYLCLVANCRERADLLALAVVSNSEFVTFPLVPWVRCGT